MKQLCPVCAGRGKVEAGFYDFGTITTKLGSDVCRTCNGVGVIDAGEGKV